MQHIEKVLISKENNQVTFHSVNEERVYSLLSYKAFLQIELSKFYPKSNQWNIDSLIDTAEAENLLIGYNDNFNEQWNDSRLISFKGTSKIIALHTDFDISFPPLRGKEVAHNNKKIVQYFKIDVKFENELSGVILSNKPISIQIGDEIEFFMTKTHGKYRKNFDTGEYYFPVYQNIEILKKRVLALGCVGCSLNR